MTYDEIRDREPLNTALAALYCGLAASTLEKMRVAGGGPVYLKLGPRKIGYDTEDLDAWKASRRRTSTSDPGASHTNGEA